MESITLPFFFVFTQFAAGGLVVCTQVPGKETGNNFFRLTGAVLLLFALLGYWILKKLLMKEPELNMPSFLMLVLWVFISSLTLYNATLWANREYLQRVFLYLGSTAGILFVVASAYGVSQLAGFASATHPVHLAVYFLSSSLLLGSAGIGMLFGHWYLVSPRLPLEPLDRMAKLYLICVLLVGLITFVSVYSPWVQTRNLFEGYRIYFWWRVIFGILASFTVAVATIFSLRPGAEKYSRTRAATGLLYVAVLTVFTGELLGRFLFVVTKVPV